MTEHDFYLTSTLCLNLENSLASPGNPCFASTRYQDNELTASIIMPSTAGDFSRLEEEDLGELVADSLGRLPRGKRSGQVRYAECRVQMPKLELATDIERVPEVLKNVGVRSMFEPSSANLTTMIQGRCKNLVFRLIRSTFDYSFVCRVIS